MVYLLISRQIPISKRTRMLLDFFRRLINQLIGITIYFDVTSVNSFPTAAGLASSSSGFSALGITLFCFVHIYY
jgi:mevalonate pyrophosphate decarboxylase